MTDHFDVFETGEDEVLQQLAADSSRADHQHLAGGEAVSQVLPKGTHQLVHDDRLETEPKPAGQSGADVRAVVGR